ncbi:MAG: heme exporter protein CcmD [Alphaproteobacteria bacterium]|nr:heme exporter protein CcmD [Alphaproteobacteria bacterium]
MDQLVTYFAMGGYAVFVWSSYAAAAIGLVGALVLSWQGWKAREREFEDLRAARRGQETQ